MPTLTAQTTTPTEVAGTVLDAIDAHPEAFNMSTWFDGSDQLEPGASLCGTTMCIAGWAAHLTGWTLVFNDSGERIQEDGEWFTFHHYAVKDGAKRTIWGVAGEALGLEPPMRDVLFQAPYEEALPLLRRMAGR